MEQADLKKINNQLLHKIQKINFDKEMIKFHQFKIKELESEVKKKN